MQVRISAGFTESVSRLDGPDRTAVKRAAFDYLAGPARPGLRLHRLAQGAGGRLWSLRVSRDLRIILHRGRDETVLCYADHHDAAYAWAAHHARVPGAGVEATLEVAAEEPRGGGSTASGATRDPSSRGEADLASAPAPGGGPARPAGAPSRHDRRLVRRASAPLPGPVEGTTRGAAPPPLVHLLRFLDEREVDPPRPEAGDVSERAASDAAGEGAGPRVRPGRARERPALAPGAWALAAIALPWLGAMGMGLGASAAAALAFGQALFAAALLGVLVRRAARAREAESREAEARVAALAAALESLRQGGAPVAPRPVPAGELGRAWAVVGRLERFLALSPGDIRRLAARPVRR